MKHFIAIAIFSFLCFPDIRLMAQDNGGMQTLTGSINHSGGYGALFFKATSFKNKSMILLGGRGAWTINRVFGIGFEANGIVPVNSYNGIDPDGLNYAFPVGGYGGLLLEPVIMSNKLVHVVFPVSAGAGWLGYVSDWQNNNYNPGNSQLFDQDIFWYVEPGVSVEVNITRFFRVDAGITRRFVQNLELIHTGTAEFDGNHFSLALKFGRF